MKDVRPKYCGLHFDTEFTAAIESICTGNVEDHNVLWGKKDIFTYKLNARVPTQVDLRIANMAAICSPGIIRYQYNALITLADKNF